MEHRTSTPAQPKWNPQVSEQACEWLVEFRTGEPNEPSRRAFLAWLKESPAHMAAYLEIAAIWNEGSSLDQKEKWSIDTLIDQAWRDTGNVVTPASFAATARQQPEAVNRQRRIIVAMAASVLLAIGGMFAWRYIERNVYTSAVGEQRSLVLADGSTVILNSRSQIRVRYSQHERAIDLLKGQALFNVAKNAAQPFVVTSGTAKVRAVGTQFDVYRKSDSTIVTVMEGRVAVSASVAGPEPNDAASTEGVDDSSGTGSPTPERAAAHEPHLLFAGQQITVARDAITAPADANVAAATAWTQRQLVFAATPLAEVAEEFNRYNPRQLIIRSAELETFEIDGVFSSTDPSALIRFLRTRPGMHITETDAEIVIASE